jgi:hypothetical protein
MVFWYSCQNPAKSKYPKTLPILIPCLIPISAFQLLSGFKFGLGKTPKLPTPVLMNRSVMVGKRKPCP